MDPNGIVAPERVLRREAQGLLEAAERIDYAEFTKAVDLVSACRPRRMRVVGRFTPRGGISTSVTAAFEAQAGGA